MLPPVAACLFSRKIHGRLYPVDLFWQKIRETSSCLLSREKKTTFSVTKRRRNNFLVYLFAPKRQKVRETVKRHLMARIHKLCSGKKPLGTRTSFLTQDMRENDFAANFATRSKNLAVLEIFVQNVGV